MAERQPHPVGDIDHGQLVQTNTPLLVKTAVPQSWADFFTLTVSTTVLGLGRARTTFNKAYITVETNPVRYTVDGTIPTANLGHLLSAGDVLILDSYSEVDEFRVIRQGAADATLMCSFGVV